MTADIVIDLRGEALREAARRAWRWREEEIVQIVNPDTDGLLSSALLHHRLGWPIIGLYDNERLWLDSSAKLPLDLERVAWIDCDVCWPGARTVSQHVVLRDPGDVAKVSALESSVNPCVLRRHCPATPQAYATKYPFGTFQWIAWLFGEGAPPREDIVRSGLAWMPDGGFRSIAGGFRRNCQSWATEILPGSILEPLAGHPDEPRRAVEVADREVQRMSGVATGWYGLQFSVTRSHGRPPVIDPCSRAGVASIQAVLDALSQLWGVTAPQLPRRMRVFEGTWKRDDSPPRGWPEVAERRGVVSLAVTRPREYSWTEPHNRRGLPTLADALPA